MTLVFIFSFGVFFAKQSSKTNFIIKQVEYKIKGMTQQYALETAVPVDQKTVFKNLDEFNIYLKKLQTDLENLRTLAYVNISPVYGKTDPNGNTPVKLIIETKDSWNIIALPYPKFDSNTGFLFKLKLKDYNFLGTMQEFNLDLNYIFSEDKEQSFSASSNFEFLFQAGPLDGKGIVDISSTIPFEKNSNDTSFSFGGGVGFSYSKLKFMKINFGLMHYFKINQNSGNPIGSKGFKYYMRDKLFLSTPFIIADLDDFGKLTWTPSFSVAGNWVFKPLRPNSIKGADLNFSHTTALGKVDWKNNFRQGLNFSLGNSYYYNTFQKGNPTISFDTTLTGYLTFFDRIGIYAKADVFYNLYNAKSERAGENLRGILNSRIKTDTAMTLSIDIPIKVLYLDMQEVTGEEWARFFGFEMHLVPFLDMAITHDAKTGRYFNPKDGWYSGGLEVIVYPLKMRSIYVRASLGVDLSELKNVPGLIKLKGTAKRDGSRISEIFIGLGLHY
ncbi:MAG: hypothetical protein CR988_05380 [Treponema sp.]|nr:MAG: hypothetical protein CR988_05380 [Treponema sp.]